MLIFLFGVLAILKFKISLLVGYHFTQEERVGIVGCNINTGMPVLWFSKFQPLPPPPPPNHQAQDSTLRKIQLTIK